MITFTCDDCGVEIIHGSDEERDVAERQDFHFCSDECRNNWSG